jgi:hypothetical protein
MHYKYHIDPIKHGPCTFCLIDASPMVTPSYAMLYPDVTLQYAYIVRGLQLGLSAT